MKQKKHGGEWVQMLMGTLGGRLLGNMLHGLTGKELIRAGDDTSRTGKSFNATSFFN